MINLNICSKNSLCIFIWEDHFYAFSGHEKKLQRKSKCTIDVQYNNQGPSNESGRGEGGPMLARP